MEPIDVYGGDDMRSIKANNTSAFNCRAVTGGSGWSEHAYGRAIDVNPFVNPYVKGSTVLPPEAARFTDRSRTDPGMIHAGDAVVDAFAARGWSWGGYWSSLKDYQHFSTTGSRSSSELSPGAGQAAVDGEELAGDVARGVAEQEDDRLGDLPRGALATERDGGLGPGGAAAGREAAERRVDEAGSDDVGADPLASALARRPAGTGR